MNDMKECKIVQDLLPSYIEKLVSKESSEYVEEHLKNCEECTNVYNDMKADLEVKTATPKAEIDYMKKARKKMRIAEKLIYIILLLFIIFVLIFWREIFSFICYIDICNRYLSYQDEVMEAGKYTVYKETDEFTEINYKMPKLLVTKLTFERDNEIYFTSIEDESDMPGVRKMIRNIYIDDFDSNKEPEMTSSILIYTNLEVADGAGTNEYAPFSPYFSLEKKVGLWDLMPNFTNIRSIRIVDGKYEIDFKDGENKGYLYRRDSYMFKIGDETYKLKIGEVSEEDIERSLLQTENTTLVDYLSDDKILSKEVTTKVSNCDQEAGTIVSYEFKISNEEDASLKYLGEAYNFDDESSNSTTKIERIREVAVTNNITYKKFQERWSGLRDLTDEDFKNYTAIIIVDKDNTKELHYKNTETGGDFARTDIYMTESEATSDYKYSACLLLVPNHLLYEKDYANASHDYYVHISNN